MSLSGVVQKSSTFSSPSCGSPASPTDSGSDEAEIQCLIGSVYMWTMFQLCLPHTFPDTFPAVHFTVYEDLHHDSWTRAYNTPELWQWMFQQRVPEKAPAGA
jgi:hypothetical protein